MSSKVALSIITTLILSLLISFSMSQPTTSDSCIAFNANLSTCQKCLDGFFLLYYFCSPCAPLCLCSSQYNFCQSCMVTPDSYKKLQLVSYRIGDKCKFCNQTVDHCLECSSQNGTSVSCNTCFEGYFKLANGSCSNTMCQSNCEICASQTLCRHCQVGYHLNNSTQICSGNQCQPNCFECQTANTCKTCMDMYYLAANNGTCQPCNNSNCLICSSQSNCLVCIPSFSLLNSTCVNNSSPNCIIYSQDGGVCLVCQPGYYNSGGSCNQCTGCDLCSTGYICYSECQSGYTSFNYNCLPNSASHAAPTLIILLIILATMILLI